MKAAPAPAAPVVRTGSCSALRKAGRCTCTAVRDLTVVGFYPTCGACGHTVAVHATQEVAA